MSPIVTKILTSPGFWMLAEKIAARVIRYLAEKYDNDLTDADVDRVERAIFTENVVRKKKRLVGPRH